MLGKDGFEWEKDMLLDDEDRKMIGLMMMEVEWVMVWLCEKTKSSLGVESRCRVLLALVSP